MPAARRLPRTPPPPRPPRLRSLRLAPIRSAESVDLDRRPARGGEQIPPFVRFDRFMAEWAWKRGQHVLTVGPTGSGKTVLNRELLRRRRYVIVLGVKNRDKELYGPFEKQGYELVHRFEPVPPAEATASKVLFVPRTDLHGLEARQAKAKAFRRVLNDVYDTGDWCVYADDIEYLSSELRLGPEFRELWQLGRSEGVEVVASSQEPVHIPKMAYGQSSHLFLFKNMDLDRARRQAELAGVNRDLAQHVLVNLPTHEFLYVARDTGQMLRSKVIRRGP
jgi:hypothetical protein